MRRTTAAVVVAALLIGGCEATGGAVLEAEQRTWCREHELPDAAGGASVAAAARELGVVSPDVEQALRALDATTADGARHMEALALAEVAGDAEALAAAQAAYAAWDAEEAAPARGRLAAAMVAWESTPQWADACAAAWGQRGGVGPTARPSPTEEPTAEPSPTPVPSPTPRLTVNKKITYTSRTSVGRLVELTIKVRNPGPLNAGKVSVEVEGGNYDLEARTPIVGCVPDCRVAAGPEGIGYVEWTAPAAGKSRAYTVQLKAKRAGSYTIRVRAYRGPSGDAVHDLGSWTVKVRVQ